MRESWALIRASWLTATSYRMAMLISLVGLAFIVLPLYFIANALQSTMQHAISPEAQQYFGFVALGAICFSLVSSCTTSLPSAIDGAIGRGTLEAILGTPARLAAICTGLMGYSVLWALLRGAILLGAATLLGANIVWRGAPLGLAVLILTMLTYAGLGLVFAAMVLIFRTTGPLTTAVLTGSMLLGGVYYPTSVIPSWVRDLAGFLPLTYGLRALRQLVLRGDSFAHVARDVQMLGAMATVSLALGTATFFAALRRARRLGTLSSY
jgi:ABC-2 type transport system permease protein